MQPVNLSLILISAVAVMSAHTSNPRRLPIAKGVGPSIGNIGSLAFGPKRVLYAADRETGTIYALELGETHTTPGTQAVHGLEEKVAATLGTDAGQINIKDLAVDPQTQNSYLSVMRGDGANAQSAIVVVDGAGKIDVVPLDSLKFSSIKPPDAVVVNFSVTHMAFRDGRLYVSGMSREEFSATFWTVGYPFTTADSGTVVENFHGTHGRFETRAPIFTFVPYSIGKELYLIAGYLCTPLVKFPVSTLTPGTQVRGTTIAELGGFNRPIDMILYKKGGKDYLLLSNSDHGVMKFDAAEFANAPAITEHVRNEGTAGVPFESITKLTNVWQLDLLDATHAVMLTGDPGDPYGQYNGQHDLAIALLP